METQLFTVGKARTLFPIQPNPSTIWRWIMHGTRGVRLNSRIIGGRRYIAKADVDQFLAELNGEPTQKPADDHSVTLANAVLESAGF